MGRRPANASSWRRVYGLLPSLALTLAIGPGRASCQEKPSETDDSTATPQPTLVRQQAVHWADFESSDPSEDRTASQAGYCEPESVRGRIETVSAISPEKLRKRHASGDVAVVDHQESPVSLSEVRARFQVRHPEAPSLFAELAGGGDRPAADLATSAPVPGIMPRLSEIPTDSGSEFQGEHPARAAAASHTEPAATAAHPRQTLERLSELDGSSVVRPNRPQSHPTNPRPQTHGRQGISRSEATAPVHHGGRPPVAHAITETGVSPWNLLAPWRRKQVPASHPKYTTGGENKRSDLVDRLRSGQGLTEDEKRQLRTGR